MEVNNKQIPNQKILGTDAQNDAQDLKPCQEGHLPPRPNMRHPPRDVPGGDSGAGGNRAGADSGAGHGNDGPNAELGDAKQIRSRWRADDSDVVVMLLLDGSEIRVIASWGQAWCLITVNSPY